MEINVGINTKKGAVQNALVAMSEPIYVGPEIVQTQVRLTRDDIVKAACEVLVDIERHANENRDRTALLKADQALLKLKELGCHETKVGALILFSKGIIHHNLAQPHEAVSSLTNCLTILRELFVRQTDAAGNELGGSGKHSEWVFSPLTPVSKLDLWHTQSDLLRAYSSLALRDPEASSKTMQLALSLIQEMKGEEKTEPISSFYAEALSCYAYYLASSADAAKPENYEKPCSMLQEAYEVMRISRPKDDPRLLHCGIELAHLLNQREKVLEGAKIINEVSENLGSQKILRVDSLWIRGALCITLLEKLIEFKDLSGEKLNSVRQSCEELKIPVRFGEGGLNSHRQRARLYALVAKTAYDELKKAEKIIKEDRRDQILPWRRIQVLEQKLRLADLLLEKKECKKIAAEIESLRKLRSQALGGLGEREGA